jgi:hypothetical protein
MTKAEQTAREIVASSRRLIRVNGHLNLEVLDEPIVIEKITAALVETGKINWPSEEDIKFEFVRNMHDGHANPAIIMISEAWFRRGIEWLREQLTKRRE